MAIEGDVIFDTNGIETPGITHIAGTSSIAVNTTGVYSIRFSVSGVEPSQFALFLNGALVPGTVATGQAQAPSRTRARRSLPSRQGMY